MIHTSLISLFVTSPSSLLSSPPRAPEPPPAVSVEGNVTASPGSRAVLSCHVVSTVAFNLTWLRGGRDARLGPQVNVLDNLSLQLSSVSPHQAGWYKCVATNEGGAASEQIYLTVQGGQSVPVVHKHSLKDFL